MSEPAASVEIGEAIIYQKVQDEIVVLNMTTQQYFGLDDVAASMWDLLLRHRDVAVAVDHFIEDYDIDRETALADFQRLIEDLIASGLLQRSHSRPV